MHLHHRSNKSSLGSVSKHKRTYIRLILIFSQTTLRPCFKVERSVNKIWLRFKKDKTSYQRPLLSQLFRKKSRKSLRRLRRKMRRRLKPKQKPKQNNKLPNLKKQLKVSLKLKSLKPNKRQRTPCSKKTPIRHCNNKKQKLTS